MKRVPFCLPAGGTGVGVLSTTSKKPKGFAVFRLLCTQTSSCEGIMSTFLLGLHKLIHLISTF